MAFVLRFIVATLIFAWATSANAQSVAKIGTTTYTTIEAAIDNAKSGEVIEVTSDAELTQSKDISGKNFTLNLAGHILTATTNIRLRLTSGASLTINGEGTLQNAGTNGKNFIHISSGCTLRIRDCIISATTTNNLGTINNQGTLIMDGGKIENKKPATSLSNPTAHDNTTALHIGAKASTTINAGEIVSNKSAIYIQNNDQPDNITIASGVHIKGQCYVAYPRKNNIDIPYGVILYTDNTNSDCDSNLVIIKLNSSEPYTCSNLKLVDKHNFDNTNISFYAQTASYEREMNTTWGTLCLPFDIDVANDDVEFYEPTVISGNTITLSHIADCIPAGTPVVIKRTDENNNKIRITGSGWTASAPTTNTMIGVFEKINVQNADQTTFYYIKDNKFWSAEKAVTIPAYRTYFTQSNPMSNSWVPLHSFELMTSNNDITALNLLTTEDNKNYIVAIYDAAGNKLPDLHNGINIVKFANGERKKIILK